MRTTVTLEPDVLALVRKTMQERHQSFKDAVNNAIRDSLAQVRREESFHTVTYAMGEPQVPLDHALRAAAEMEDAEIARKLSVGK